MSTSYRLLPLALLAQKWFVYPVSYALEVTAHNNHSDCIQSQQQVTFS